MELRLPTDAELVELVALVDRGVHDPAYMPFAAPWTDAPPAERARSLYGWHCSQRGAVAPAKWSLLLVAFAGDEPVGVQDIAATEFAIRREVGTASWVGLEHQGRGIGTAMRHGVLGFAFDSLHATDAVSGAYLDNPASNRVSERCGYVPDGTRIHVRERGELAPGGATRERTLEQRYRVTRDAWRATAPPPVEVVGLDSELRALLGAAGD